MVYSMAEAVRVAIAVGYLGRGYSGSQVQPNVPTVQGELEAALFRLKWCEHGTHPVTLSSRTDGGVDARMNIGSFDLPEQIWNSVGEKGIITAINDQIPTDIRVWAAQSVDPDLRTRNAYCRTYLYRLQALKGWPSVTISDFSQWCSIFIGEHDFRNFCRPQEGRSTVKRVLACEPWLDENKQILGFTIKAEGFVWNQVRRIASAMLGLARGRFHLMKFLKLSPLQRLLLISVAQNPNGSHCGRLITPGLHIFVSNQKSILNYPCMLKVYLMAAPIVCGLTKPEVSKISYTRQPG